jgi:hypothetical protein
LEAKNWKETAVSRNEPAVNFRSLLSRLADSFDGSAWGRNGPGVLTQVEFIIYPAF